LRTALALLALIVLCTSAGAHGDAEHAAKPAAARSTTQHEWGVEGDPAKVTRTIVIEMSDRMRFSPDLLTVKLGETVRLRVSNGGAALHELVLGTPAELARHAELMKKHPGMEHDEPYMAHVPAGRRNDIVWTFNRAGRFMFGCLLPGHWEAGMQGHIEVRADASRP
jgi:uncharacterized cupredoxin-like copper-binding protein